MTSATDAPIGCFPWEDVVEIRQNGQRSTGLAILIICIFLITINLLLSLLILINKKLRDERNYLFIVATGGFEMMLMLFLIVFNQPGIIPGRYIEAVNASAGACRTWNIFGVIFLCGPWYNFLAWTCDRLYAIKRPLAYRALRGNKRQFSMLIGLCWLMAIVPTVPLWFDKTILEAWERGAELGLACKCWYPLENRVWTVWCSVTAFILPTLTILAIWAFMYHFMYINTGINSTVRSNPVVRDWNRKTIGFTILFLLTVGPFCLLFIFSTFTLPKDTAVMDISFAGALLNGIVRPVICMCTMAPLREAFIRVVRCEEAAKSQRFNSVNNSSNSAY